MIEEKKTRRREKRKFCEIKCVGDIQMMKEELFNTIICVKTQYVSSRSREYKNYCTLTLHFIKGSPISRSS